MSRMITPEFLCSVFSDTGECLRSAQCVSCVATLAPTHQHWRLCVLILSPGVSTSQHVASVAHQQTGYQLYLWLFFVHCCCKSVTFPAVSRPAQESAAPWWAADPEQRQCIGAVVSGHQWSHQHCHGKLRTRAPQVSDRSQVSRGSETWSDAKGRLANEKVSVEIRSWPLLPRDDTRNRRWPRSLSETMTTSSRQKLSQSLQSFAASSLASSLSSSLASNLASLVLWSSVDPASISSVLLFPLLHLGTQPTQLNT